MKHSTRAPTKYETERIEAMKRLGCVACAALGVPNLNALELHHILDGGKRMGHWFTIFLCRGHHQGDWSAAQHVEDEHRVAISDGRKRFRLIYGTERSLWERVQTKLKLTKAWPVSKRVPREGVRHVESNKNLVGIPEGSGISASPAAEAAQVLSAVLGLEDRRNGEAQ